MAASQLCLNVKVQAFSVAWCLDSRQAWLQWGHVASTFFSVHMPRAAVSLTCYLVPGREKATCTSHPPPWWVCTANGSCLYGAETPEGPGPGLTRSRLFIFKTLVSRAHRVRDNGSFLGSVTSTFLFPPSGTLSLGPESSWSLLAWTSVCPFCH